jgi:hypothetical protein
MIIFKKVRGKNFLSIGNNFFEYELDKENTTLIAGKNGDGKCLDHLTKIKLKNKNDGKEIEISIGDFYQLLKKYKK